MYIEITIIEFDLELTDDEAVSNISWKNAILKGQEKHTTIQSDLDKIWDEDVAVQPLTANGNHAHRLHRVYQV